MIRTIILWIAAHHLTAAAAAAISVSVCISISVILLCYCHCGEWNSNCLPNHFMRTTNISRRTHSHIHALILCQKAVMQNGYRQLCAMLSRSNRFVYEIHLSIFMLVSVNIKCIFQILINCLQQPFGVTYSSYRVHCLLIEWIDTTYLYTIYIKWFYVSVCRSAFVVPHHLINKLNWSIIRKIRIMTVRSIIRLGMLRLHYVDHYSILEWIQIYTMQLHVLIVIYHVHRQQ